MPICNQINFEQALSVGLAIVMLVTMIMIQILVFTGHIFELSWIRDAKSGVRRECIRAIIFHSCASFWAVYKHRFYSCANSLAVHEH